MSKRRNGVTYDPVREEVHISQLIRVHPTMDKLRPYQGRHIKTYARSCIDFLNNIHIASDVVKEVLKMADRADFKRGKNF